MNVEGGSMELKVMEGENMLRALAKHLGHAGEFGTGPGESAGDTTSASVRGSSRKKSPGLSTTLTQRKPEQENQPAGELTVTEIGSDTRELRENLMKEMA